MKLTTWRDLLGPFLVSSAVSLAVFRVIGALTSTVPNVPIAAVFTMVGVSVAFGMLTLVIRPRLMLSPGREPLDPLAAGRVVALAFASSRAGVVIGGIFVGWLAAGWFADALTTPFAKTRALHAAFCIVLSAALVAIGVILERACVVRVPRDDNDQPKA